MWRPCWEHVDACTQCGFVRISYNSCRDRHCPKCQATQREQWIEARLDRVLPVTHFHVVFTLPDQINPLMLRNRAALYNLLFAAASRTLLELANDPKRLGAQVGLTAILHTWGQNLLFHPHLHCVVTAGGLSPDGQRWVPTREDYLLPVKGVGRLFRGKFLAALNALYKEGGLAFAGSTAHLADRRVFAALRDRLYRQDWIVYAKPPFGGTEQVFRYLGRYSHRVAISNSRLLSLQDGIVAFRYKDYRDAGEGAATVASRPHLAGPRAGLDRPGPPPMPLLPGSPDSAPPDRSPHGVPRICVGGWRCPGATNGFLITHEYSVMQRHDETSGAPRGRAAGSHGPASPTPCAAKACALAARSRRVRSHRPLAFQGPCATGPTHATPLCRLSLHALASMTTP
jgi:hypothetical protein